MSANPSEDSHWAGTDPFALLDALYPIGTLGTAVLQSRKCRLYLVACARRQWGRLPGVCRGLVELAEGDVASAREWERRRAQFAPIAERLMGSDGDAHDLHAACAELMAGLEHVPADLRGAVRAAHGSAAPAPAPAAPEWRRLATLVCLPFVQTVPPFTWVPAEFHSADLVREVHYNPHRFVLFPDAWRSPEVLAVARHAYDARAFGDMPVLGDALEDAGCDDPEVLQHCRGAPADAHVRGCWVLDRVLDRG